MQTRTQYLLARLAEEAVEVAQRALKAQAFGLTERQPDHPLNNVERLNAELGDLDGLRRMLCHDGVTLPSSEDDIRAKRVRVEKFMEYAIQQGQLEPTASAYGGWQPVTKEHPDHGGYVQGYDNNTGRQLICRRTQDGRWWPDSVHVSSAPEDVPLDADITLYRDMPPGPPLSLRTAVEKVGA